MMCDTSTSLAMRPLVVTDAHRTIASDIVDHAVRVGAPQRPDVEHVAFSVAALLVDMADGLDGRVDGIEADMLAAGVPVDVSDTVTLSVAVPLRGAADFVVNVRHTSRGWFVDSITYLADRLADRVSDTRGAWECTRVAAYDVNLGPRVMTIESVSLDPCIIAALRSVVYDVDDDDDGHFEYDTPDDGA